MIDAFFKNRNQYRFTVGFLFDVLSVEITSTDVLWKESSCFDSSIVIGDNRYRFPCGKRVGSLISVLSLVVY